MACLNPSKVQGNSIPEVAIMDIVQEIRDSLGTLVNRVTDIEDILAAHTKKGEAKLGGIVERLDAISSTCFQNFVEQTSVFEEKMAEQTSSLETYITELFVKN